MSVEDGEKRTPDKLDPETLRRLVGDLGGLDAPKKIEALVRMGPSLGPLVRGLPELSFLGRSSRSHHRPRGRRRFSALLGFDF